MPNNAVDTWPSRLRRPKGTDIAAFIHTHPVASDRFSGLPKGDGQFVLDVKTSLNAEVPLYVSIPGRTNAQSKRPVITGFGTVGVLQYEHVKPYIGSSVQGFSGNLVAKLEPYRKPTESEKYEYMMKYGPGHLARIAGLNDVYDSLSYEAYLEYQNTGALPSSVEPMYFEELQCLRTWEKGSVLRYG